MERGGRGVSRTFYLSSSFFFLYVAARETPHNELVLNRPTATKAFDSFSTFSDFSEHHNREERPHSVPYILVAYFVSNFAQDSSYSRVEGPFQVLRMAVFKLG